jgi:hypothetical protein
MYLSKTILITEDILLIYPPNYNVVITTHYPYAHKRTVPLCPLKGLVLTLGHAVLLFGYQLWQEDALVPAVKKLFSAKLQPAAAKPAFEDEEGNNNNR